MDIQITKIKMDLAIQNPWWKNKSEIEKDEKVAEALKRSPKVIYIFKEKSNKIILGPRQVGKTSMLKLLIYDLIINKQINPTDICYFSCEPLKTKNDLINVLKEFEKLSPEKSFKYVFLDEVTQIPDWELAIKFILETILSKRKNLIVTGSNALLLKKGSERLPGRNISIELFLPLSFREFLLKFGSVKLKQKLKSLGMNNLSNLERINKNTLQLSIFLNEVEIMFDTYLKTGGYLKAIYEQFENKKISEETYEIYIKWILGDLSKLNRKEYIFKDIIKGLIKNYGTKFSLHSIAKDTETKSHVSVADYLEIFQGLLLTNQLYQLDYSRKTPVFRKERKSYFIDPFIYSVCKGYVNGKYQNFSSDNQESLIEGVICEALTRLCQKNRITNLEVSSSLWFYLKKKETDFILKENNNLIALELKWQNRVSKSDFNNFFLFKKRILLSKNQHEFNKEKNFLIIPTHLFLSIIG